MLRLPLVSILLWLAGCAAGVSPDFAVPAGRYSAAFDAARDALIADRFDLERVDAAGESFSSRPLTPEVVAEADCVILLTPHSCFDYAMLRERAKLILDSRNSYKGMGGANVVPL